MLIPLVLAMGFALGMSVVYVTQYRTPCGNNSVGHKLAHITGTQSNSLCMLEFGKLAISGMTQGLPKGAVNMLKELPKVGDKVRYVGPVYSFMTVGKEYEVTDVKENGFCYYDDNGYLTFDREEEFDEWEVVDSDAVGVEVIGLSEIYPKYYKDVSGVDSIDVYKTNELFGIDDPSGAIQHASKKLLLSGVRTGGKSKYDDIKEARDTLNRWLEINVAKAQS